MEKQMMPWKRGCLLVLVPFMTQALLCLFSTGALANANTIKLNCTDRYWYPFVFVADEQPSGIFVDIVNQALENLNMKARLTGVPYKRAIKNSLKGKIDGIVGLGFSPGLAESLEFPGDAETDTSSKWHIARVDHVVVSSVKNSYRFKGDIHSLPSPLRLRQGSLLLHELEKAGVVIHELRDDIQGIRQLGRDGTGVVITTSVYAEKIAKNAAYKGKLKIHGTPLASRSYYLAFSKSRRLTRQQKLSIWEEIRRLRSDYLFILKVYSRY